VFDLPEIKKYIFIQYGARVFLTFPTLGVVLSKGGWKKRKSKAPFKHTVGFYGGDIILID
jgi:hypothetical protein